MFELNRDKRGKNACHCGKNTCRLKVMQKQKKKT